MEPTFGVGWCRLCQVSHAKASPGHAIGPLSFGASGLEHGPVNPRALAVLGAWFFTREIELSLVLCKNVTVVTDGGVLAVKWRLPASKTDPMAVAVVRELGCMCQGCSAALSVLHM